MSTLADRPPHWHFLLILMQWRMDRQRSLAEDPGLRREWPSFPLRRAPLAHADFTQFPINVKVTPEAVKAKWNVITRFDENSSNPESTSDSIATVRLLACSMLTPLTPVFTADCRELRQRGRRRRKLFLGRRRGL